MPQEQEREDGGSPPARGRRNNTETRIAQKGGRSGFLAFGDGEMDLVLCPEIHSPRDDLTGRIWGVK